MRLSWNLKPSAQTYRVQMSKAADFSSLVIDSSGVSDTTMLAPPLESYTIYHWRVRAVNQVGPGDWAAAFRFRTMVVNAVGETRYVETEPASSGEKLRGLRVPVRTGSPVYVVVGP